MVKMLSPLGFLFPVLFLFACNPLEQCREELKSTLPIVDSLYQAVDSVEFHRQSKSIKENAQCLLEHGESSPADKLEAEVLLSRMKEWENGWACHERIQEMEDFHRVWMERSELMSDVEWEKARLTWEGLILEFQKEGLPCTEDDLARLSSMKSSVTMLDAVGGDWQPLIDDFEQGLEEVQNQLQGLMEQWLSD